MNKSVLGLLGGASALALVSGGAALAATSPASDPPALRPAQSFAELLDPVPNAVNTLRAQEENGDLLQLAQLVIGTPGYNNHHHHHHHHHQRMVRRHHHHHHHHQNGIVIPLPGNH